MPQLSLVGIVIGFRHELGAQLSPGEMQRPHAGSQQSSPMSQVVGPQLTLSSTYGMPHVR
jgi:hypothetical protein